MDSLKHSDGPAHKPKRYRLVTSRVEAQGARIKRLRLARMEALARLEPRTRTARPSL